jgi:hypothetical protein
MARVLLETLTAGMKLNKPVFNLNGVLLLRAGEVLTTKHLDIFKTWGVREADVVREDGSEPEVTAAVIASPEIVAAVEREIARRFRRAEPAKDAVMADIMRVAARHLTARLAAPLSNTAVRPERQGRIA